MAPSSVGPFRPSARPLLACNCRMSLVGRTTGEIKTVKARAWDCPSCGLDKQRQIALMCSLARSPLRMLTGTFQQPLDLGEAAPAPARHARCDRRTHVYVSTRDQVARWRLMSNCAHCCRYVSDVVAKFRKRLRRRFGDHVRFLWAREDHPTSGAIHLHMAFAGLPPMGRHTRSGRWVKKQWSEVGGGFLDLGEIFTDTERAGWYIGKYLAKRHDQSMAKGYRRWSRTRNFSPDVLMKPPAVWDGHEPPEVPPPPESFVLDGWLHPVSGDLWARRFWLAAADPGPV